jgi:signal transduction histidine kinase
MKNFFEKMNVWNFKKVPYFFEKNQIDIEQKNYALLGKLSASLLHDVLSPLTSLLLASDLQIQPNKLYPIIADSSKSLREYLEIMRGFLNQENNKEHILLNEEIKKCILLIKHKAIQSNVQIQFIEFNQVYIKINPLYIYQIVINLITNAIESLEKSEIKKIILILKSTKKYIVIECKDFGCGISSEQMRKIGLYRFSTKSKSRGFGLYSINHIITHICKGSITIESKINEGTLFTCLLPLKK